MSKMTHTSDIDGDTPIDMVLGVAINLGMNEMRKRLIFHPDSDQFVSHDDMDAMRRVARELRTGKRFIINKEATS